MVSLPVRADRDVAFLNSGETQVRGPIRLSAEQIRALRMGTRYRDMWPGEPQEHLPDHRLGDLYEPR